MNDFQLYEICKMENITNKIPEISCTDIQKCLAKVSPSNWRTWFINPVIGRNRPDVNRAVERKARLLKGFCITFSIMLFYLKMCFPVWGKAHVLRGGLPITPCRRRSAGFSR
jgi:hypothetical protein